MLWRLRWWLFCGLFFAGLVKGSGFDVADMNPLTMNYATPPAWLGNKLPTGALSLSLGVNLANSLHAEQHLGSPEEQIFLDYELTRTALGIAYGLSSDWQLRLEVPFFAYNGGGLDGHIDGYHQRFHFAEGPRPNYPNNQLALIYERDYQRLLDIQTPKNGIGDARLMLERNVETGFEDNLSYGILIKAPSNQGASLTSSGTVDGAIWLSAANRLNRYWSHYLSVGGVLMEKNTGLLASMRRDGYGVGHYGLQLDASRKVKLRAQLSYRGAIYHSALKILGAATTLTLGGQVLLGERGALDFAISEDANVGTAPDVSLLMQASIRFGK